MKRTLLLPWFSVSLLASAATSQAALTSFTDYELGGVTASWDIFYGSNYQTSYSFETGTAGNPSNATVPVALTTVQTSFIPAVPGYVGPTGPTAADDVEGEQFYTFFSNNSWNISGTVADSLTTLVLQALIVEGSQGGFSNVLLNGTEATASSTADGVTTWTWSGLDLAAGDSFSLAWSTGIHTSIDAIQIQANANLVPEPSSFALLGLGLATAAFRRRRA